VHHNPTFNASVCLLCRSQQTFFCLSLHVQIGCLCTFYLVDIAHQHKTWEWELSITIRNTLSCRSVFDALQCSMRCFVPVLLFGSAICCDELCSPFMLILQTSSFLASGQVFLTFRYCSWWVSMLGWSMVAYGSDEFLCLLSIFFFVSRSLQDKIERYTIAIDVKTSAYCWWVSLSAHQLIATPNHSNHMICIEPSWRSESKVTYVFLNFAGILFAVMMIFWWKIRLLVFASQHCQACILSIYQFCLLFAGWTACSCLLFWPLAGWK